MSVLSGRVKSVLSGDTLVLTNAKGMEKTLSLAYISAPRLKREGDEPFAFQSREYLRENVLGKVVHFEVLYTIPTTKREYGRVRVPDGPELPDQIVAGGWSKLRDDAGKREENEDALAYLDNLRVLESEAKESSKGVWGRGGLVESTSEVSDPSAVVEKYKGKKLDAIIEKVLTGDRLIARLLLSPTKHLQTMVVLAGARAPATKKTSPEGKDIPAELGGTEAHQFTEDRLHQRKVGIELLGVTPQNQLIGNVLHPRGNIALFLLEAGLARSNDQHVTLLGNQMTQFRQAENAAKNARKGVFAGVAASKASGIQEADFTVIRVLNAETVFLRTRGGEERKVGLSSIRQPKPTDPKQSPFGAEAKEFLRKRLIGKHVKVTVDGRKPASEGYEEKEVATIIVNGKNAALALVEAGYASVIRHRRDDDDRSPEYDALLLAEEAAQKEEKGMWSPKPPAAKQYQDYSENLQKAKMEASVLQRQKKVPAVVDFVRSGARFVVLVPRENAKLTFVLSGIRTPKPARNPGDTAEPFGQEALEFANRRCLQRDVEIDVETTDKVGGFIGTMYVGRENFARALVEEGLAQVHAYSAEQSGHGNELFAAEKKAKEGRKGLWHDWDPSKDVEEAAVVPTNGTKESAEPTTRRKDYRDVTVSFVDETGKLKLQQIGSGTASLLEMMESFRTFHLNKANEQSLSGAPKVGEFVAAKFSEDGLWYRARVRRVDRDAKKADILFIDYGNAESKPWSQLRPLTQPQFSTQKLKAQAVDARLSYLQFPGAPQYLSETINFLNEITYDRELVANVDAIDSDNTLFVTLMDPKVSTSIEHSINADVVREGLALVPKKLKTWEKSATETLASLKKLQTEASESRRGMFEYGDLIDDE